MNRYGASRECYDAGFQFAVAFLSHTVKSRNLRRGTAAVVRLRGGEANGCLRGRHGERVMTENVWTLGILHRDYLSSTRAVSAIVDGGPGPRQRVIIRAAPIDPCLRKSRYISHMVVVLCGDTGGVRFISSALKGLIGRDADECRRSRILNGDRR